MHATAFLQKPDDQELGSVIALSGGDRYLKLTVLDLILKRVLGGENEDLGLVRFEGKDIDARTLLDELSMVSMWGDRRVVLVESADDFITKNRPVLEKYADAPAKKSLLIFDVKSWMKTTRLAKAVQKIGLHLECNPLSESDLARWLVQQAKSEHQKKLERSSAALIVELVGTDLGLVAQELTKLVNYVGDRETINDEDVRTLVGGWKAETTWVMINALRDGQLSEALSALDKLLVSGEAPQKILGGMTFVFRKFTKATQISRSGVPIGKALAQAGVFPRDIQASEQYLRRVGRPHAEHLSEILLETDGNLKGGSRVPERVQLEQLVVKLSGAK